MRKLLVSLLCLTVGCATASSTSAPSSSSSSDASKSASATAVKPGEKLDTLSLDELKAEAEKVRKSQDWERMRSLNRELARREPNNEEPVAYAGLANIMLGQKEEGIAEVEKSLAMKDNAPLRYVLATLLLEMKEPQRALEHLERAAQLDPSAVRVWRDLALTRAQLGKLDEAFAAADRVNALAPGAPQAEELLMFLAQFHAAARVPPEAAQHYAQGTQLVNEGKQDAAMAELEAALKLAPGYADGRYNLARLLSQKGDKARAEQEYRKAIPAYHEREKLLRADAQNNLASLLVERGAKGDEAVTLVRAAIAVRGERPSYLDTLARACDAKGDKACAVESFRKLLASSQPLPFEVKTHAEERLKKLAP